MSKVVKVDPKQFDNIVGLFSDINPLNVNGSWTHTTPKAKFLTIVCRDNLDTVASYLPDASIITWKGGDGRYNWFYVIVSHRTAQYTVDRFASGLIFAKAWDWNQWREAEEDLGERVFGARSSDKAGR